MNSKMLVILGIALLLNMPVSAEEKVSKKVHSEAADSSEEPLHYQVTVTAARAPTEWKRTGRSVTVVTAEEIRRQGAMTVQQALENVTGFHFAQGGSFGSPSSVFVRGGESDFNLVLIDGVQVNLAGGAVDFADLSTANIERIEIVKGPSSVLYGTEAAASTIHIITRSGSTSRPRGRLRAEGGSFGTFNYQGNLQGGSESISYSLGALTTDTDGIFDLNSGYRRTELSARGDFATSRSSTLTTSLRYTASRQNFPTDGTGAVLDPNDFRKNRREVYSVAWQTQPSTTFNTRLQYGYHRLHAQDFTLADGVVDFFDSEFSTRQDRHYMDWQNTLAIHSDHLLTAGLSFNRESSNALSLNRRSVGLYLQDQFSLGDRATATAGVRYDENDLFSDFVTGHLEFAFLISEGLKVRSSLGNGFRAPSFSEIQGFPDFGILGNPALDPEKNTAFEIGLDYIDRSRAWSFSGTAFFNQFSDLIEFAFAVPTGTPNYINVEAARSRGMELEARYPLTELVTLGGLYTLTLTRVTESGNDPNGNFVEGEKLLRRPKHAGAVYTEWAWSRLNARIDLRYKGDRDDRQFFPDFSSQRVVLPDYWRVDLSASVPVARFGDERELLLVFRGRNLLDKEYTEIAGFPSPGRSFYGGLELGF